MSRAESFCVSSSCAAESPSTGRCEARRGTVVQVSAASRVGSPIRPLSAGPLAQTGPRGVEDDRAFSRARSRSRWIARARDRGPVVLDVEVLAWESLPCSASAARRALGGASAAADQLERARRDSRPRASSPSTSTLVDVPADAAVKALRARRCGTGARGTQAVRPSA